MTHHLIQKLGKVPSSLSKYSVVPNQNLGSKILQLVHRMSKDVDIFFKESQIEKN